MKTRMEMYEMKLSCPRNCSRFRNALYTRRLQIAEFQQYLKILLLVVFLRCIHLEFSVEEHKGIMKFWQNQMLCSIIKIGRQVACENSRLTSGGFPPHRPERVWKPPDVRRLFSQASRQGIGWSLYVYLFIYTTVVRLRLITDFTEIVLYKGEGLIILKHYHSQQHHKNIEDIKTLEIYIAWLISLLRRQLNPDYIATARLF